jgi:hypothetical protein
MILSGRNGRILLYKLKAISLKLIITISMLRSRSSKDKTLHLKTRSSSRRKRFLNSRRRVKLRQSLSVSILKKSARTKVLSLILRRKELESEKNCKILSINMSKRRLSISFRLRPIKSLRKKTNSSRLKMINSLIRRKKLRKHLNLLNQLWNL